MKKLYKAIYIDKHGQFEVNVPWAESPEEAIRLSNVHCSVKDGSAKLVKVCETFKN